MVRTSRRGRDTPGSIPGVDTSVYACLCCAIGAPAWHKASTQAQQELRTSARLAQPVERKALNLVVVSSSPTVGDMFAKHESRKLSNQGIGTGKTPAIFGFEDQRLMN